MSALKCLRCGKYLSIVESFKEQGPPSPYDLTVCLYCDYVMAFRQDLTLRRLPSKERLDAAADRGGDARKRRRPAPSQLVCTALATGPAQPDIIRPAVAADCD
jgi:hypothetical protein